jgi:hypothetical protein
MVGLCIDLLFRSHERPRLNERFLYLIYFATYLGFIQGIYHVANDRARLVFPEKPVRLHGSLRGASPANWSYRFRHHKMRLRNSFPLWCGTLGLWF